MRGSPSICNDPRTSFLSVLQASGYTAPKTLSIGRIDRIDGPEDRPGKKSGWYSYQELNDTQNDGYTIGVASFGSWKLGTSETWCSRGMHQMNVQEQLAYTAAREAMKREQERETLEKQTEAALLAFQIWSESSATPDSHPYLVKKGIKSHGLRLAKDGRIIVPVAVDGQIVSLQFIDGEGAKRFLTGGRIKGGWYVIDGETDIIYIAEGYATAESVAEATGKTVYIAFNAGNLYEVAAFVKNKHGQSRIIIAGDDDTGTAGNPGRTKAEQTAQGLGIECIFPSGVVDFNDMHKQFGIHALKEFLSPSKLAAYVKEPPRHGEITRPPGALGDIYDYYMATSGNYQPGFAIQTALATASLMLGRSFKTSYENFTALYFINVGKSSTGKEHAKSVIEEVLHATGYGEYIAGDGYTSAGAVFSTLLDKPKHISVNDEFGRYLEAGRDLQKGSHHQREANTKLMEAIGRCHTVMRPPSYSSMTLKKDQADQIKNRIVHNPSITLMGITTPDTLFKTLDMAAIKDGFINRFIISVSEAERDIRYHKTMLEVPDRIIRWAHDIQARNDKPHIAGEPAAPVILEFSKEAMDAQMEFQRYCVDVANKLEKFGMSELPGRSNEFAMRISLICALSRHHGAREIKLEDMQWGIDYIKHCLERTIEKLKISLSHSDFEHFKKEILADLRARSPDGITWRDMQKQPPYSQHKPKDLKEIMQALKDAELAGEEPYNDGGRGRPTTLWRALK